MATKSQDAQQAAPGWSNTPLPGLDAEMRTPTPREQRLSELAEKAKKIEPQRYDVTSKNTKARRVIYDHRGRSVAIEPGATKESVLLHPNMVEQLRGRGSDLEFVTSS